MIIKKKMIYAVSSFPFYDIPPNTEVFVTSSNKILGAIPGCAIVAVKKDNWGHFISDTIVSTLNLNRFKKYIDKNQTPTTPPVQVIWHLLECLKIYDTNKTKENIIKNSNLITSSIGVENIIGEKICPVITIPKSLIPIELAKKYELYHLNTNDNTYQIFTYSDKDKYYEYFANDINSIKK